jgi:hypothetical protein
MAGCGGITVTAAASAAAAEEKEAAAVGAAEHRLKHRMTCGYTFKCSTAVETLCENGWTKDGQK